MADCERIVTAPEWTAPAPDIQAVRPLDLLGRTLAQPAVSRVGEPGQRQNLELQVVGQWKAQQMGLVSGDA